MRTKDQFPFTGKGFGWQKEHKGYDVVVYVEKNKGIALYVFGKDGRIEYEDHKTSFDKDEFMKYGFNHIDIITAYREQQLMSKVAKISDSIKSKCEQAAIKALSSSAYLRNIRGEDYDKLESMFKYELDKQFNKIN